MNPLPELHSPALGPVLSFLLVSYLTNTLSVPVGRGPSPWLHLEITLGALRRYYVSLTQDQSSRRLWELARGTCISKIFLGDSSLQPVKRLRVGECADSESILCSLTAAYFQPGPVISLPDTPLCPVLTVQVSGDPAGALAMV